MFQIFHVKLSNCIFLQGSLTSGPDWTGNPPNRQRRGLKSINTSTRAVKVFKLLKDSCSDIKQGDIFYFLASLSGFTWNIEEDFKTVPETWIPAHRVKHHNGHPVPDEHGHIPGSLKYFGLYVCS